MMMLMMAILLSAMPCLLQALHGYGKYVMVGIMIIMVGANTHSTTEENFSQQSIMNRSKID